ncbi:uncharacterized protein L201_001588 [Kwoniella dendrophila CBS 6074]|uniref:Oxidoreductase-like domain-containing protein n=1 Tax=Kwoniella dendrophila CBS 6074 TaxID=1295534 RepID=A0AAX4JMR6_9TREE
MPLLSRYIAPITQARITKGFRQNGQSLVDKRGISNIPPVRRKRQLNQLSKYQQHVSAPISDTPLKDVIGGLPSNGGLDSIENGDDVFQTTSTKPVLSSIQEIPSVKTETQGVRLANTLPAMKDTYEIDKAKKKEGGRRKEINVQGIIVPPKPIPPGEEECCMSGCVNCVYTIYADDLELYQSSVESAKNALKEMKIPEVDWPEELKGRPKSEEEIKEGVENNVDPVMSAFLALENKLKKK